ncbi:MAG: hypothetical protein AB7I30_09040, partial [Isosphaeraceae bacterium]
TTGIDSGQHGHRGAVRSVTVGDGPSLELVTSVGPPISGLPPAGVDTAGGSSNIPVFPFPFGGNPIGGLPQGKGFPAPYPPQTYTGLAQTLGLTTSQNSGSSLSAASRFGASVPRTSRVRRPTPRLGVARADDSLAASRRSAPPETLTIARSRAVRN